MIVVTGGAGFVGSNIVKVLLEAGEKNVVVVDDLTDGVKFANISDLAIADYLDMQQLPARLRGSSAFSKSLKAIIHQGACSDTTEQNGRFMMHTNYDYSKILLAETLSSNVPFIYASSAAVYGDSKACAEKPENERPLNLYAYSKLLFDDHVRRVADDKPVAGLRYFNVYGPREQHKGRMQSVALQCYRQIVSEGVCKLFESGEQMRDFVYVEDVAAIVLWFLDNPRSGVFNVGTGKAASFNELAQAVIRYCGKGEIAYIPMPEDLHGKYQDFTEADLTRLRAVGCDVELRPVAEGVPAYLAAL